jgi:hypothetical protein
MCNVLHMIHGNQSRNYEWSRSGLKVLWIMLSHGTLAS